MTQRITMLAPAGIFAIAGLAACAALVTTEPVAQDTSQVVAAFERELNHAPGPAARIRRESVEHDELYEALNRVHWTSEARANAAEPAQPLPAEGAHNEEAYD
ncbi:MAG: hypothetical protein OEZ11_14850 [Gammaproteobacteria bacterium]|nr:hypothetical protein [Gammaproteobacteria bacterium]